MRGLLVAAVVVALGACAASKAKSPDSPGSGEYTPPSNEMTETTPEAPPPTDGRGYCDIPHRGMCSEFPADSYDSGRELCAQHGTWTDYGCPTANVLGYCTNPEQGGGAVLTLYSGSTYASAEQAAADKCADPGDIFTPAY